jgi:hypothetical protein
VCLRLLLKFLVDAVMYVGRCDAVDQEVRISVMSCFGWDVFGNFLEVPLYRMWRYYCAVPLLSHFLYAEQATITGRPESRAKGRGTKTP